jgi:transposase InsO family protein
VVRGQKRRTTIPDGQAERARDLVDRDFTASAPNRLWVSDFTYVAAWQGVVYVAFTIDAFSRRIVGWKADTSMKTSLVLDTLEMALWARDHHGQPVPKGLISHSDAGSQYTSFAFTQRLVDAGADPSIGSIGDGYDNAVAESTIGLYKTELINQQGPCKTIEQVEFATLQWVDWYNHQRLHGSCDRQTPVEYEHTRARQTTQQKPPPQFAERFSLMTSRTRCCCEARRACHVQRSATWHTIVDRITAGIERRARECRWYSGRPPFGYTLKDGQLTPDPVTAPTVRRIYQLSRTGFDGDQIVSFCLS